MMANTSTNNTKKLTGEITSRKIEFKTDIPLGIVGGTLDLTLTSALPYITGTVEFYVPKVLSQEQITHQKITITTTVTGKKTDETTTSKIVGYILPQHCYKEKVDAYYIYEAQFFSCFAMAEQEVIPFAKSDCSPHDLLMDIFDKSNYIKAEDFNLNLLNNYSNFTSKRHMPSISMNRSVTDILSELFNTFNVQAFYDLESGNYTLQEYKPLTEEASYIPGSIQGLQPGKLPTLFHLFNVKPASPISQQTITTTGINLYNPERTLTGGNVQKAEQSRTLYATTQDACTVGTLLTKEPPQSWKGESPVPLPMGKILTIPFKDTAIPNAACYVHTQVLKLRYTPHFSNIGDFTVPLNSWQISFQTQTHLAEPSQLPKINQVAHYLVMVEPGNSTTGVNVKKEDGTFSNNRSAVKVLGINDSKALLIPNASSEGVIHAPPVAGSLIVLSQIGGLFGPAYLGETLYSGQQTSPLEKADGEIVITRAKSKTDTKGSEPKITLQNGKSAGIALTTGTTGLSMRHDGVIEFTCGDVKFEISAKGIRVYDPQKRSFGFIDGDFSIESPAGNYTEIVSKHTTASLTGFKVTAAPTTIELNTTKV